MIRVHVCSGCNRLTTGPGRCPVCVGMKDTARYADRAFYWSRPWRRKRKRQLLRHPFCAVLGCERMAQEVDHIIPRRNGGTDNDANLQSLCKPHHSAKTMSEVRGRGVPHV